MSNPTNKNFSSDISGLRTTDWRPNKALYVNVKDNNSYRQYLQKNGNTIRSQQLQGVEKNMGDCVCEGKPSAPIKPFVAQYTMCKTTTPTGWSW